MPRGRQQSVCLDGRRIGKLLILGEFMEDPRKQGANNVRYVCLCDCGSVVLYRRRYLVDSLKAGIVRSCGCVQKEFMNKLGKQNITHGGTGTRLHKIWRGMKSRCLTPGVPYYKNYGGRGISICPEWVNDFAAFRDWALTHGYNDTLTIERIDNDGNYCPGNCRWATRLEQARNKRCAVCIFTGERESLQKRAKALGIQWRNLYKLIHKGMSVEEAFAYSLAKRS